MRQRLLRPALDRARDRGGDHDASRKARPKTPAEHTGWDPEVERAREAGGPVDMASYVCGCGYFFSAPVSTTVSCPHCHIDQAW